MTHTEPSRERERGPLGCSAQLSGRRKSCGLGTDQGGGDTEAKRGEKECKNARMQECNAAPIRGAEIASASGVLVISHFSLRCVYLHSHT